MNKNLDITVQLEQPNKNKQDDKDLQKYLEELKNL